MKTKFDVEDVLTLNLTKRRDDDEGIVLDCYFVLEMFPDNHLPIDYAEWVRLAKSFSRKYPTREIIEA